jgi:CBS domain-containing protein
MRISDVLRVKGGQVVTVTPDTDVRHLLTVLAEHRIGAVVVSHNGTSVDGIASERDIVRALAQRGATVMSEAITAIYTAEVHTVTPETPVEEVMRIMTEHRVRHTPVVVDGALRGIVSIGDVVKNRIDELETERAHLTNYITDTRLARRLSLQTPPTISTEPPRGNWLYDRTGNVTAVVAMLGVLHRQACLSCLTFFSTAGTNDWLPDWLPRVEHSSLNNGLRAPRAGFEPAAYC